MQNTNSSSKGYLFPLVVIGILFFMIGFALGINGLIIPFLRTALDLTTAESYLVLAATFSTFIIFLLRKIKALPCSCWLLSLVVSVIPCCRQL